MRVIDHQTASDLCIGMNIDPEDFTDTGLNEVRKVLPTLLPKPVPDPIRLNGLIAFEVEERLQQRMAGRIPLVNSNDISPRRIGERGVRSIGVLATLA